MGRIQVWAFNDSTMLQNFRHKRPKIGCLCRFQWSPESPTLFRMRHDNLLRYWSKLHERPRTSLAETRGSGTPEALREHGFKVSRAGRVGSVYSRRTSKNLDSIGGRVHGFFFGWPTFCFGQSVVIRAALLADSCPVCATPLSSADYLERHEVTFVKGEFRGEPGTVIVAECSCGHTAVIPLSVSPRRAA